MCKEFIIQIFLNGIPFFQQHNNYKRSLDLINSGQNYPANAFFETNQKFMGISFMNQYYVELLELDIFTYNLAGKSDVFLHKRENTRESHLFIALL